MKSSQTQRPRCKHMEKLESRTTACSDKKEDVVEGPSRRAKPDVCPYTLLSQSQNSETTSDKRSQPNKLARTQRVPGTPETLPSWGLGLRAAATNSWKQRTGWWWPGAGAGKRGDQDLLINRYKIPLCERNALWRAAAWLGA